jgi:hypothetical protein
MSNKLSDSVREHVIATYIAPARRRRESKVTVVAGDVHKGLGLRSRVPLVCNAMRSKALLSDADVRIIDDAGPPSGLSTTVAITYELLPPIRRADATTGQRPQRDLLIGQMRGFARDIFAKLGGGEQYIRDEREAFHGRKSGK